ncbi:MAG: hypothetical protein IIA75_01595 [Proteobacteria bacterium]|nr:hypothetical protein [Pseudomonadota bacterium]
MDNPVDTTASNDSTTDPATVTVSDRVIGQVIVDAVVAQSVGLAVGAGQIEHYQLGLGVLEEGANSTEPGVSGDVVMSWADATISSWAIVAIALNPEPRAVVGAAAQFGPQVFVRPTGVVAY